MSMKRCPKCAEKIHHSAIICRYCGADLQEIEAASVVQKDLHELELVASGETEETSLDAAADPVVEKKARRRFYIFRACSVLLMMPILLFVAGWIAISLVRGNQPAAQANLRLNPPGRVVYLASHPEKWSDPGIFIMNADGSDRQQLVEYSSISGLSVSPDGRYAAFTMVGEDHRKHIFRIDLNSGELLQLTESMVPEVLGDGLGYGLSYLDEYSAMWSPTAEKLLFIDRFVDFKENGETVYSSDIVIMNIDGSNQVPITSPNILSENGQPFTWWLPEYDPIWSPDGTQIIYLGYYGAIEPGEGGDQWVWEDDLEITIMNADGSQLRQLTDNDAYDGEVVWSPNGSQIAFLSDREGMDEIYVMSLLTGITERLTYSEEKDQISHLRWSPDGTRLAFAYYDNSTLKNSIQLMDVQSKQVTILWEPNDLAINDDSSSTGVSEFGYLNPEWSPDGNWMLLLSGDRNNTHDVWVVNVKKPSQRIKIDDDYDYIITEAIWVPEQ